MSLFALDTDTFTLAQRGQPKVCQQIITHLADVTTTAITIQEQMDGWRGRLGLARNQPAQIEAAYQSLVNVLLPSWSTFLVHPFTALALQRFEHLVALRLNVGRMDLRIAAIALEVGAIVVTRNQR